MKAALFAFAALAFFVCVTADSESGTAVYYSTSLWRRKLSQYRRACNDIGMPAKSRDCLLAAGYSVQPQRHLIGGRYIWAILDTVAMKTVVDAFSRCIPNIAEDRVGSVRAVVEPTTPLRKLANRLGFKETVRGYCGGCEGGCHFCCVNSGISGEDYCFLIFCRGKKSYCR